MTFTNGIRNDVFRNASAANARHLFMSTDSVNSLRESEK